MFNLWGEDKKIKRESKYRQPELKHFRSLELCRRNAETELMAGNYNPKMHEAFLG